MAAMARKARPGISVKGAAVRRELSTRRRTEHYAPGYGKRTAGGKTKRIVKPARRTGRGVRSFVSALHPRAANGRFKRKR